MEPLLALNGLTPNEKIQKEDLEKKQNSHNITNQEKDTLAKLVEKEKNHKITAA